MTTHRLAADLLLEASPESGELRWSGRDCAIYNLGIGFGAAAMRDERLLRYVTEEDARAFPTMISVLEMGTEGLMDPRYGIDWTGAVHGEEAIELLRPLPAEGTLHGRREIVGIWDKGEGRGAVLCVRRIVTDPASGATVATTRSTIMLRNNGGYGGSNEGAPRPLASPDRAPDGQVYTTTLPEQALLYRLAGDRNPLHSDPATARRAGFPRPILMGLCSFGIAGRGLVTVLADGNSDRLSALSLRFVGVVFPGETLRIDYWQLDDGEVAFRGVVVDRDVVALDGGRARLTGGAEAPD